ncbi:4Fe-4S dicluster domain-containing protein [Malonomonas rubra]|uniref:4Fe-4S dicluster domain-containing protein n=1 Tax=Malonomonas rubra TaxID=57040 RepID=UPI0026F1B5E5|nr:4Fe-4S dicluster domain-containing protein [Malonomonas rubra]
MSRTHNIDKLSGFLGPWRKTFQWLSTLLILLLPWFQPGGKSLLRIDVPTLSLHLFGQVLRIEELFLFLLFCLAFSIAFLLITLLSGRVWCGWACPQTTWNDLAEWFARVMKLEVRHNRLKGAVWRKTVVQLFYLFLAALVAANLIWYFIEPRRFFTNLFSGELPFGIWLTLLCLMLTIFLDLSFIRRLMCKEFCPYGRIQTALVDEATLTLQMPESEKERCIECCSCIASCPMEIDIRQGLQVECINCGRCLDACRKVMRSYQQPGLIRYTLGIDDLPIKSLFNPRSITLLLAFLVINFVLFFSIFTRTDASLKIAVSHTAESRILKSGKQATFFNAWINNRGTHAAIYQLSARTLTSDKVELKGQTDQLDMSAGQNRKVDFVLVSPPAREPFVVEFVLLDQKEQQLAVAEALISPVRD